MKCFIHFNYICICYLYLYLWIFIFNVIKHQSVLCAVFSLFSNKIYFINVICAAADRCDLKHKNVKNSPSITHLCRFKPYANDLCGGECTWTDPNALPAWLGNYFRESRRLCSRYALVKKHSNGGLGRLVKSARFSCQAHSWNLSCLISCFFSVFQIDQELKTIRW